ncbi:MAG: hypothetical protein H7X88_04500 [Gloeobacteraceae cyanobacterium ES-bin-316]|nr:hypothetical protein [Ferruginibacter sp.]
MKYTLLILSFFIASFALGQDNEKSNLPDSLFAKNLFGEIRQNLGYCNNSVILYPNMTFEKSSGCCRGDSVEDSGTWQLLNNSLLLKSNTQAITLSIIGFGPYYYFVPETNRQIFTSDLNIAKKKYQRVFKQRGKKAADDFIMISLTRKYYSMRSPIIGT